MSIKFSVEHWSHYLTLNFNATELCSPAVVVLVDGADFCPCVTSQNLKTVLVITVVWKLIKFNDMTFCKHITSVLLNIYSFMKKYFTPMVYLASLLHRLFMLIWNVPCVTQQFLLFMCFKFFFHWNWLYHRLHMW